VITRTAGASPEKSVIPFGFVPMTGKAMRAGRPSRVDVADGPVTTWMPVLVTSCARTARNPAVALFPVQH